MKIVATHMNADLDALASMIAATRLYEGSVAVASSMVSQPVHRYLALHKDHYPMAVVEEVDPTDVDEIIVVDVRDRRRLRDFHDFIDNAGHITVFDHHPATEHDIDADEETVEAVGACITLLVERLREADVEITPTEATLYMLGLYADTGRLSFSTTRPRDIETAAFLLRKGARLKVVNRYLRRQYTDEQHELLVELMSTAEEFSVDAVEVAFATAQADKFVRGASGLLEEVLEFGGHDAIFGVIAFKKNRVQIIGRSRVSYVNIGEMLADFGGGGHSGAGAASLKDTTVEDVVERLEERLTRTPLEPVRVAEIMTSDVCWIDDDATLREAGETLDAWDVSGAPVMRDGELFGVVSRRDIERATRGGKLDLPVSSHMSHNVVCIDHKEPIEDTLDVMTAEDVGRLPVTREGEIVGIVTRTDLIRRLYMKQRDDADLGEA